MSELIELIRQRDALDMKIAELAKRKAEERAETWSEIDKYLGERIRGRWRKDDLIFEMIDVTVTLHNRLGECWMTVLWTPDCRAEFRDPPPLNALRAFIKELEEACHEC